MVTLPSNITPEELDQAQRLILKGKEYAAFGDPKMLRTIQFLRERGFESPESARIRQEFLKQIEAKKQLSIQKETKPAQIIGPQRLPSTTKTTISARPQQKITLGVSPQKSLKIGKNVLDFVSGGYLTERNINKKQESINQDILKFNKRFEGRELEESEYAEAQRLAKAIKLREEQVKKEQDRLASSLKSKLAGVYDFTTRRRTSEQLEKEIKGNQPKIKKKEAELKKIESQIKTSSSKLNIKRLKAVKSGIESEIERLKTGSRATILTGDLPLVPAYNIPSGVTNIKFIGTQKKGSGGKILTDVVFKTDKGRMGIAKGVTVAKGKTASSVVLGRSGKVSFKFPTGKQKVINIRSFIGREKSLTKPLSLTVSKNVNLLSKSKKIGTIAKIQKNLKGLQQAGIGQVGTIKGKKFVKAGKVLKGIQIDDFSSLSAIFTKKDLSLIVGKSITGVGAKSKFIGIIKGTSKIPKTGFTATQKTQYSKALQKVLGVASASLSRAEKTSGLTKTGSLALAGKLASDIAKGRPISKTTLTTPKAKVKPKPKTIPKKPTPKTTIKYKSASATATTTKQLPKSKQETTTTTKPKSKTKQITKQLPKSKSKRKSAIKQQQRSLAGQKLRVRQLTLQRSKSKALAKVVRARGIPTGRGGFRKIIIPKRKGKKRIVGVKRKTIKRQPYNVYARPLKKKGAKRQPKLIKVNKVPLSKARAEDLRNYITDTSLARTAQIKRTRGKIRPSKLKIPYGYSKRTKRKFRTYRIIKGRRKSLPKGRVIEKRRNILDTRQEKRQISLARRIKQITKRPVGRPKLKRPAGRPKITRPVGRPRIKKPIGRPRTKRPVGRPKKRR